MDSQTGGKRKLSAYNKFMKKYLNEQLKERYDQTSTSKSYARWRR